MFTQNKEELLEISTKNVQVFQAILGALMIISAAYTVFFYTEFLTDLNDSLLRAGLEEISAIGVVLSLFPFIGFFLGALLILTLYIRKTLWCCILFFGLTGVFLALASAYTSMVVSTLFFIFILCLKIYGKRIPKSMFSKDNYYL